MGLTLLKELFFFLPKRSISPKLGTKLNNILIWGMRINQNFLSFLFSRHFYFSYLLRFIFFLAVVKSWVLIMGKGHSRPKSLHFLDRARRLWGTLGKRNQNWLCHLPSACSVQNQNGGLLGCSYCVCLEESWERRKLSLKS